MLKAIFYARFHPERGPSVVHQYPKNAILSSNADQKPLINFSDISSYVIPSYELCGRPLSVCMSGFRILGFPISIEDDKYERNRFTFNVCFVLDEGEDARPWTRVVAKTAHFAINVEGTEGLFQTEELLQGLKWAGDRDYPAEDVGIVYRLLRSTYEELNAYRETCIRLNDLHVLNLRLAMPKAIPPRVRIWDVPLLIRPLPDTNEWTWDLVLQQIHPYTNGVNHVQRIAELADVDVKLVKNAVQELLRHSRVLLLDIFHFQAIYTLTADLSWFTKDDSMLEECSAYVAKPTTSRPSSHTLISLYCDLNTGTSVADFYLSNFTLFATLDIRRFITFGVIKGFLRRIHKYALAIDSSPSGTAQNTASGSPTKQSQPAMETSTEHDDHAYKRAALSSGWATPPADTRPASSRPLTAITENGHQTSDQDARLRRFLDGKHCMDEMCVSLHMSEKQVLQRLKEGNFGEFMIFNK